MSRPSRPRPALFRALGAAEPPAVVQIGADQYELAHLYKHDSWAATARYHGAAGDVVCKFNRVQPILGMPMHWLGQRLARRERHFLRQLDGLAGIPAACPDVYVNGRPCTHAVAHAFVPGEPLGARHNLNDQFFPRLRTLLAAVHLRGLAYVDLHKRENVLVSEQGDPYLIDFQVCFGWSRRWARTCVGSFLLRALQNADCYHLAKHIANHRPDQQEVLASLAAGKRPGWIKAHRLVAVPFRKLRRGLLTWLGIRQPRGRADSETFPEEAVRQTRRAA